MLVEVADALNHLTWLVGGGGVVQPHQLFVVDALLQNGEITAHGLYVKSGMAVLLARCGGSMGTVWMRFGRGDKTAGQRDGIHKIKLGGCLGVSCDCCVWGSAGGRRSAKVGRYIRKGSHS